MDHGFIKPTIPAEGQGTKAIFTRDDVYSLALFMSLIRQGFNRTIAGYFCNDLKKHGKLRDYKIFFMANWIGDATHGQTSTSSDVIHRVNPKDMSPKMKKIYKDYQETLKKFKGSGPDIDLEGDLRNLEDLLDEYHEKHGTPQHREPQDIIQDFFIGGKPYTISSGGDEWDHLHVINFGKIRRKVDFLLSSLD
jgi:hypothetical protein